MNNYRANILVHIALAAVGNLMLFAGSRPWDASMGMVSVVGVSSGVLSLQVMWAELRPALRGRRARHG